MPEPGGGRAREHADALKHASMARSAGKGDERCRPEGEDRHVPARLEEASATNRASPARSNDGRESTGRVGGGAAGAEVLTAWRCEMRPAGTRRRPGSMAWEAFRCLATEEELIGRD
jgi:hypothetical protein